MPLEQIGSNLRLFGKSKVYDNPSTDRDDHDDRIRTSSYLQDDEEMVQWQDSNDDPTMSLNNNEFSSSTRYHQDDDMVLSKLGGVGGVQRSGSWAYGSRYAGRPSAFQSSLYDSTEVSDSPAIAIESKDTINSNPMMTTNKQISPRTIPWRSSSLHETDSEHVQQRYNNVSSNISRSSTSSSSTAAFSLRSLSNRNSTSSNGSSAGSSMRRLTSDEGHANSVGSTVSALSSTTVTSEDASMNSESTIGRTENRKSFSIHESPLKEQDGYSSSSSQVVPRVQRIQSIGRGFDVRKWNKSDREGDAITDSNENSTVIEISPRSSIHTETDQVSKADTTVSQIEEDHSSDNDVADDLDDNLSEKAADQTAIERIPDDTITSLSHSPTPQAIMSDSLTLSPEPRSDTSQSGERRNLFGSLTLTAAAQADRSESDNSAFILPEPRRHTGSYALRSRSALSQTVGSSSMQFGNGQGRAAARKELNKKLAKQSILNNDLSFSNLNTPRASVVDIQAPRSSPADVTHWQAKAFALSNLSQSGISSEEISSSVSPLTRPKELTMSPVLDPTSLADNGEGNLSPIARASPDALSLLQAVSLDTSISSRLLNAPASPLLLQENRDEAMSASQNSLDIPSAESGMQHTNEDINPGESKEGPHNSRPSLARSSTSLAGMNVLRTPTTEEWSRYLIKQGLDPSLMASSANNNAIASRSNLKDARSRTNTSRSGVAGSIFNSSAPKRRISDRESVWGRTNSLNSSTEALPSDLLNITSERGSLTNMPNDLILAEIARQQQLRQRVSATTDEMRSVHEDERDEEEQEILGEDDEKEMIERLSQGAFDDSDEIEENESDEEDLSDGIDEHMRALHEAISRPPSRRGTPAPSESGREKPSEFEFDHLQNANNEARRNLRWPTRDTAAFLANYPLPPPGEQRSIHDFFIVDDIGRGAYGLVKKARVRDEKTGEPIGPEFAIKYIIKSRILADCWRRHKALGPIPVEIHVLDQLRRLAYAVPIESPGWSAEKLFDCSAIPPLGSTKVETVEGESVSVTVGHPSLCMMVDFFEDHEFYYMVMPKFGSGQDLFDFVESQPHGLTTKHVRCIFGQLADGLRFLHANNIVHRDVKDENVILDGNGHIQLIDFGSAAHIQSRRLFDTFSGTLDYAAAEILRGEKYGGKEQDVWALGVVGYVLLCGDCPFWNGEEAMEGLKMGTRAFTVLADRNREITKAEAIEGFTESSPSSNPSDKDKFSGQSIPTSSSDEIEHLLLRRKEDIQGQTDGGGRLDDATDLIIQCLCLDPNLRPSMEQICQHRFLIGKEGWIGRKGWETRI